MSKNVDSFLEQLELSKNERSIYLANVALGNALVKDIAKKARLNRTTAYNILLGLRKRGFVSSYKKSGVIHFSATPPVYLADLIDKRIERQEKLKSQLHALLPELNGLFDSSGRGANTKIFEGIENIPEIYRTLYAHARYPDEGLELTNWGGKFDLFPTKMRTNLIEQLQKVDVTVRSLLIEDELTRTWVEDDTGQEMRKDIRLLPNPGWDFFANLEVVKDKIAIVTYKDEVDFQGVLIQSRELAAMFRLMFETLWASAEYNKN